MTITVLLVIGLYLVFHFQIMPRLTGKMTVAPPGYREVLAVEADRPWTTVTARKDDGRVTNEWIMKIGEGREEALSVQYNPNKQTPREFVNGLKHTLDLVAGDRYRLNIIRDDPQDMLFEWSAGDRAAIGPVNVIMRVLPGNKVGLHTARVSSYPGMTPEQRQEWIDVLNRATVRTEYGSK